MVVCTYVQQVVLSKNVKDRGLDELLFFESRERLLCCYVGGDLNMYEANIHIVTRVCWVGMGMM